VNTNTFARELDLDLDDLPICLACLSFVAMAIDAGDELEIRRWTRKMTPDLWDEGLALPARLAVERAQRRRARRSRGTCGHQRAGTARPRRSRNCPATRRGLVRTRTGRSAQDGVRAVRTGVTR
jgi:hypothetical protein